MWLCGKKLLSGPLVGIASTVFWVAMACQAHLWSMVPFEAIYLYLETCMALLWYRDRVPVLELTEPVI